MHPARRPPSPRPCRRSSGGFTLIELMVVIGIIVLLAAILLPVVSRVRQTAYDTSTQQQMARIMQACQQYYHEFNAYPGPIANVYLYGGSQKGTDPTAPTGVTGGGNAITSSENLVLGLFGYLDPRSPTAPATIPPTYNNGGSATGQPPGPPPHDVLSLNPLRPAKYNYIDYSPGELSGGSANSLEALTGVMLNDTNVPEFIDRFASPMPILYIRANVGATDTPQANNKDFGNGNQLVQYNYLELSAYGCNVQTNSGPRAAMLDDAYFTTALVGASTDLSGTYADWNGMKQVNGAYDGYLTNPNIGGGTNQSATGGAVRGKDGFILISAGKDRTYGTHDDTIVTP